MGLLLRLFWHNEVAIEDSREDHGSTYKHPWCPLRRVSSQK